jgi:hypothetical protein
MRACVRRVGDMFVCTEHGYGAVSVLQCTATAATDTPRRRCVKGSSDSDMRGESVERVPCCCKVCELSVGGSIQR